MKRILLGALPFLCIFLVMAFIYKAQPIQDLRKHSVRSIALGIAPIRNMHRCRENSMRALYTALTGMLRTDCVLLVWNRQKYMRFK